VVSRSAIVMPTGIGNQSLDAVDATKSDKRSALSLCLLSCGRLGAAKRGAAVSCNLDKREHPTSVAIIFTCGQLEQFFSGCSDVCDIFLKKIEEVHLPLSLPRNLQRSLPLSLSLITSVASAALSAAQPPHLRLGALC
jgi:hypothetical protein